MQATIPGEWVERVKGIFYSPLFLVKAKYV